MSGYIGIVAERIDYDAGRQPMFQDDQGNGWVPIARFYELWDALQFYASPENWEKGREIDGKHRSLTNWDRGDIARDALGHDAR